jgi:hypothetical protein
LDGDFHKKIKFPLRISAGCLVLAPTKTKSIAGHNVKPCQMNAGVLYQARRWCHNDDLDDDLGGSSIENEVECDDFSGKDAFFIGSAMGWAYEEGLWKGVLQRQKKKAKKKL